MVSIDRTRYPALDDILWDVQTRYIPAKDALMYYEQRWRHVNVEVLSGREQALIDELTMTYGHGVFLPAK